MKTALLLVMPVLMLSACTTKKDTIRADTEWKAPEVNCQQARTPPIPDLPPMWFLEGPAWAAQVLGIAIEERRLRKLEHDCLDDHRKKGLIR